MCYYSTAVQIVCSTKRLILAPKKGLMCCLSRCLMCYSGTIWQKHSVTEYAELESIHKDHQGQLLGLHSAILKSLKHLVHESITQMLLEASVRLGAVTTALGASAQSPSG